VKGLVGLLTFLVVLALWILPVFNRQTGLEWADNLFNQLAKSSAYYVPSVAKRVERFKDVVVDLSVNPRWAGGDRAVAKILMVNGISASLIGDGRVRIRGSLEGLSLAASADADLLFKGREESLRSKYGLNGKEVIYYWWTAFDDLSRRYLQLNRPDEADFARFITSRVLEPSYNFAGIEPRTVSENVGIIAAILLFYVVYTLWYGFSIMYLFEGFGVQAKKSTSKKEA
jgi:hypothetical protein